MDSKLCTQAHSVSLLFIQDTGVQLILYSGMLNQLQILDYKGSSTPMGLYGPCFELIYIVSMDYEGWIGSRFTCVHKGILVIMQDCTGVSEQGLWIELID